MKTTPEKPMKDSKLTKEELSELNELFSKNEEKLTNLAKVCLKKEQVIKKIKLEFKNELKTHKKEQDFSSQTLSLFLQKLNSKYGNSNYNLKNGEISVIKE